ncbi:hypothetical protein ACFQLX_03890 [Streptomyces polyrhachis]|uniref:Integral membrane protein n=1 Tax=Streptomyces polyrhachis TaxID=1282885 RepID=A0ABW2G953_9ACTN
MAVVTGVALMLEGVGIAGVQWVMADFLDRQNMSLDGLETGLMSGVVRGGGLLTGGLLCVAGVFALRLALREAAAGRFVRLLLVSVAVVHALLAVVVAALVGWGAFALLAVVGGLVVFTVLAYGPAPADDVRDAPPAVPAVS